MFRQIMVLATNHKITNYVGQETSLKCYISSLQSSFHCWKKQLRRKQNTLIRVTERSTELLYVWHEYLGPLNYRSEVLQGLGLDFKQESYMDPECPAQGSY